MLVSILHISDLHRDKNDHVSNTVLINSLLQDIEQHTASEACLNQPDLLIVSGDIVQGVMKDDPRASDNLKDQYDEAKKFLVELSNHLFNGDRSRIVIIPGNHDIDFSRMYSSLEKVDIESIPDRKNDYSDLLFSRDTKYRWSWSDFTLYKIIDQDLYDSRFDAFISFYNSFYRGDKTYGTTPESHYSIFDFPQFGLTFLAFNSCFENDPWRRHGSVHPDCIATVCNSLRDRKYRNRLRLAVWHHSTRGGPGKDDYLDADFLQQLINQGISLGFHGHHHKPEMLDEKYAFGGEKKINVISAGTLCGGEQALPSGRPRGFNRIMIDTEKSTAQLFVRKMVNENFKNPIWGKDRDLPKFFFQVANIASIIGSVKEDLNIAEKMIREGNYAEAAEILEPLVGKNEFAKPLLLVAFSELKNNSGIIRLFNPPQSTQEILIVLNALHEEGKIEELKSLIDSDEISKHIDPAVVQLRLKYSKRYQK